MKRWHTLLVGLVLAASGLAACGADDTPGGPQAFYDGALRFDLPTGWRVHADPIQALCLGQSGHIVLSSAAIPDAQFYATRDVAGDASGGTLVIAELLGFERQRGPQAPLRNYLLFLGDAVDDDAVEFLTLNGQPAARLVSDAAPGRIHYSVSVFVDDAILVLVLLAGDAADQPQFDTLVESLAVDAGVLLPLLTRPAPES